MKDDLLLEDASFEVMPEIADELAAMAGETGVIATPPSVNRNSPAYIRWLQESLNRILGLRLAPDGRMGAQTRSAIRSFQQKQGLAADGIVGVATERALLKSMTNRPSGRVLTYTTKDVIDPRIDVAAQHSLVRMSKNPATNADAVAMLEAVKAGQLAGIYQEDQRVPAQRALHLGKRGWVDLIPSGQDSALVPDPADQKGGPPLIAVRRNMASFPTKIDAALRYAWNNYTRSAKNIRIREDHSIKMNRIYSKQLGWHAYESSIRYLLELESGFPSEKDFARAVAHWQRKNETPRVDGIIDQATLNAMQPSLSANVMNKDGKRRFLHPYQSEIRYENCLHNENCLKKSQEVDYFWSGKILQTGHEIITNIALKQLGAGQASDITLEDKFALHRGVVAPDQVDYKVQITDPTQTKRHATRTLKCQPQLEAIKDICSHLRKLYVAALNSNERAKAFHYFGEAIHLIQDSYCPAHMERRLYPDDEWGGYPIIYIRYWTLNPFAPPLEHAVVDKRDAISKCGKLTDWARLAVAATKNFLEVALMDLGKRKLPSPEFRLYIKIHFEISPQYRPTSCENL